MGPRFAMLSARCELGHGLAVCGSDAALHRSLRRALGASALLLPRAHGQPARWRGEVLLALRSGRLQALLASPLDGAAPPLAWPHVQSWHAEAPLDARDVLLLADGRGALLGVGRHSSRLAARELARFAQAPVLVLELADPLVPHLRQALELREDGTAILAPGALRPRSVDELRAHPSVRRIVAAGALRRPPELVLPLPELEAIELQPVR